MRRSRCSLTLLLLAGIRRSTKLGRPSPQRREVDEARNVVSQKLGRDARQGRQEVGEFERRFWCTRGQKNHRVQRTSRDPAELNRELAQKSGRVPFALIDRVSARSPTTAPGAVAQPACFEQLSSRCRSAVHG